MTVRRIFIAFPAPPEIIAIQNELRKLNESFAKVKWTRNQNLHLTFYFIGNIEEEKLVVVSEKIKKIAGLLHPFTLNFESLYFAPKVRPRMLWAKFSDNESFTIFSNKIHAELIPVIGEGNKFFYQKPIPHITLSRFHSFRNYQDLTLPDKIVVPPLQINYFELWETVNMNGRSDYRAVSHYLLSRVVEF